MVLPNPPNAGSIDLINGAFLSFLNVLIISSYLQIAEEDPFSLLLEVK